MRKILLKYVSLSMLLFLFGTELFGLNSDRGGVAGKEICTEGERDDSTLSTAEIDHGWAIERSLVFSQQEISFSGNREHISLLYYRNIQLSSLKIDVALSEKILSQENFNTLLELRHQEGFYVYQLCKIII